MSRVTSWDDEEPYPNAAALFERSVDNAILGRRGQALLRELEEALLAMPIKRLVGSRVCEAGEVCALGALAIHRAVKSGKSRTAALAGLQVVAEHWGQGREDGWEEQDDETQALLRDLLNIKSKNLAWTLVFQNDEAYAKTPEDRYARMLKWVQSRIRRHYGYYTAPAPFETDWHLR